VEMAKFCEEYEHDEPFWNPQVKAASGLTITFLLAAAIISLSSGNDWFFVNAIMMGIVFVIIGYIHHSVRLNNATIWALSGWCVIHMAGGLIPIPATWPIEGDIPVLYSWWLIPDYLKYDNIVHAYGFGVTTWVCWQGLAVGFKRVGATLQPTFGMLLLCWAAGMGLGSINEIIEFPPTMMLADINLGGYVNTSLDLISNMLGSLVAVIIIWYCSRLTEEDEEE
jgi:hypothetical protein